MNPPPRRRLLRSLPTVVSLNPRQMARQQRRQTQLSKSRASLKRWLTRLKRATSTVVALHRLIARLEAALHSA